MKLIYCLLICIPSFMYAQVGIGTQAPNKSAALDISSEDKGFLLPRLTKGQAEAITDPAQGLLIICTDCCPEQTVAYYDGHDWLALNSCDSVPLPPITETDFTLVAGSDPHHLTASEMPFLFDGDINPPAGVNNMNLHTFHENHPNPNTLELASADTFPIGTKISVYWYNSITESDHLELSFSIDGGLTYTNAFTSPNSALTGVTYVFTVYAPIEFTAIRLKATLPPSSGEMIEPYLNEILVNDGATTITFQN